MNFPPANLSPFHSDVLQQTKLGQLCGREQLFRDRYEVIRMLGRGGFGVTFLARDMYLPGNPLCVIKQLCPKTSDAIVLETARKRFECEAKTLAKLGSHAHIPMLLDYFTIDGEFYLVQEYVQGATLARLVRRFGVMSEIEVKVFLHEMLHILHYIHKHNVIHRDIKPQNIIRCEDDGRLVLIDFGAVKETIAQSDDTGVSNFIGTVGFAPPEQFSLRSVYASDIYALGITCIYLLTGKGPLDLESDRATGEIRWRGEVQVSDSLGDILDKMVKVALEERYLSARAVLRSLYKESPPEDLLYCLATQPFLDMGLTENDIESSSEQYIPPIVRTAIAIREWKARLEARAAGLT